MRKELRKYMGRRLYCRAKFQKFGLRGCFPDQIETVALTEIARADTNEFLAKHLWMTDTKPFRAAGQLNDGDQVEFHATVARYERGYQGKDIEKLLKCPRSIDYTLVNITGVRRVQQQDLNTDNLQLRLAASSDVPDGKPKLK